MLIDPGFVSAAMASAFSPAARVQRMLEFEAALARVEGRLGLIPTESAAAIARACDRRVDAEQILRRGWELGSPLLPLLELLRGDLSPEHAVHLHHGATTQDAVDTASALELKMGLGVLDRQIEDLARLLRELARAHRATPQMARTLLQHARPTRFGLTVARWIVPFIRASEEIARARRLLPVQMGGAVGALDGLNGRGLDLTVDLAAELGLATPILPWHTDRTPIALCVSAAALTLRAALKTASDLVLLAQSDVAELKMRGGGSSRMPHKQNPIDAVRAVAASQAGLGFCASFTTTGPHELERAAGAWQTEWLFVPLVFYCAGAALEALETALGTLEVDARRMRRLSGIEAEDDAALEGADALIDQALAAADAHWLADDEL